MQSLIFVLSCVKCSGSVLAVFDVLYISTLHMVASATLHKHTQFKHLFPHLLSLQGF